MTSKRNDEEINSIGDEVVEDAPFQFPASFDECMSVLTPDYFKPLKICMGHTSLLSEEVAKLGMAIPTAKTLTHLFLIYTPLSVDSLKNLVKGLKRSPTLLHLDLTGCGFGDDGMDVLSRYLRKNKSLISCNLAENEISDVGAEYVAEVISGNFHLSHFKLPGNEFTPAVVDILLKVLPNNLTLLSLDLGHISSYRVKSLLEKNSIARDLLFEKTLIHNESNRTRFLSYKINVFGDHKSGKTAFLDTLILNDRHEYTDQEKAKRKTVKTQASAAAPDVDIFPKINIRRVKTWDKLKIWTEVGDQMNSGVDYLTDHALRTSLQYFEQYKRKAGNPNFKRKVPKKLSNQTQETKATGSDSNDDKVSDPEVASISFAEDFISVDDGFSRADEELDSYSLDQGAQSSNSGTLTASNKSLKNRAASSTNTMKSKIKSLKSYASYRTIDSSMAETDDEGTDPATSVSGDADAFTVMGYGNSNSTPDLNFVDLHLDIKSDSGSEISVNSGESTFSIEGSKKGFFAKKADKKVSGSSADRNASSRKSVIERFISKNDVVDTTKASNSDLTLEDYVALFTSEHNRDMNHGDKAASLVYKQLKKGYKPPKSRKQKEEETKDPDAALRTLSKAFKENEAQVHIDAINSQKRRERRRSSVHSKKSIYGKSLRQRKSQYGSSNTRRRRGTNASRMSLESTATEKYEKSSNSKYKLRKRRNTWNKRNRIDSPDSKIPLPMRRPYLEDYLDDRKANMFGLNLQFWEFSDNFMYNNIFRGFYSTLMTKDTYGLNIISIDLVKFIKYKTTAVKSFFSYLQILKSKPDTRLLIVGQKLDSLSSHKDLYLVNDELKNGLRDSKTKGLIFNKESHLVFFPVDNTRVFGHAEIRGKIIASAKSNDSVRRNMRLKDMALLDILLCKRSNQNELAPATVTIHEIRYWADQLKITKFEMQNLIELFENAGLLIYYPTASSLKHVVITNVEVCLDNIMLLLNNRVLLKTFNVLYGTFDPNAIDVSGDLKGDTDDVSERKQIIITRKMIEHIMNDVMKFDVNVFILYLLHQNLMAGFKFGTGQFFEQYMNQDRIKDVPKDEDPKLNDKFLVTPLFNHRVEIYTFDVALKQLYKREKKGEDIETIIEKWMPIIKEFDYQILFRSSDDRVYPTSFNSSLLNMLVSFFSKHKSVSKSSTADINVQFHKDPDSQVIITEFCLGSVARFFLKPELRGISFFVPEKEKTGIFAAFVLMRAMVDKVNSSVLGVDLPLDVKSGKRSIPGSGKIGKLTNVRKYIKSKKQKLGDYFDNFVGTETLKIRSIDQLQNFLRMSHV